MLVGMEGGCTQRLLASHIVYLRTCAAAVLARYTFDPQNDGSDLAWSHRSGCSDHALNYFVGHTSSIWIAEGCYRNDACCLLAMTLCGQERCRQFVVVLTLSFLVTAATARATLSVRHAAVHVIVMIPRQLMLSVSRPTETHVNKPASQNNSSQGPYPSPARAGVQRTLRGRSNGAQR